MDSLQFPSLSSVLGSPTPSDVTPRPPQNGNVSEEDSDEFSGESSENGEEEDLTWIDWFTHLNGNEYFAEIDEDFLRDDFNLTGLSSAVWMHFSPWINCDDMYRFSTTNMQWISY